MPATRFSLGNSALDTKPQREIRKCVVRQSTLDDATRRNLANTSAVRRAVHQTSREMEEAADKIGWFKKYISIFVVECIAHATADLFRLLILVV